MHFDIDPQHLGLVFELDQSADVSVSVSCVCLLSQHLVIILVLTFCLSPTSEYLQRYRERTRARVSTLPGLAFFRAMTVSVSHPRPSKPTLPVCMPVKLCVHRPLLLLLSIDTLYLDSFEEL
jgi:hypothetical protein